MTMHASPLSNHVLFQTGDLDCARERVAEKFCSHRLELLGDRAQFDAAHHHVPGTMLSLNYIRYGADVLVDPGELEHFYLIQMQVRGGATIRNGCDEFSTDADHASVLNPHWATRMRWWAGCEQILVQVKKAPFHAFVERLLDRVLPGPVAFAPRIDLTRPEMKQWRALAAALFQKAETGPAPDISSSLCEQQLLELFFRQQPNNMSHFIDDAPAAPAPRHLRRANEFLRENAAEPIGVLDIAEAAGVTARTLQTAFRSAYGLSPMHALGRERLRRVRFDLMDAGGPATVADAALKWGFSHLGRFSQAYHRQYGEMPKDTLRARGEAVPSAAGRRPH
ncbi:helix-turn-helix domain-containing protein [Mesorhizobium sp. LHD-90]|uniref:AraC family transcriptional regulator n=1 Tax=Mesorhizobium sp. LHD-90 TaxID=3071414 RepID=UPI0027DECF4E|nr:helix-turn-helix domain-containing protein [Mesorhizobium sp. LHD-90]MDQ6433699.1 helix-turn-helix domain-containing protein [Mesorhizobium sp. LHD-90]